MELEGKLFQYKTNPPLQAFISQNGHSKSSNFIIILGGLTDGLLAVPYVTSVTARCSSIPSSPPKRYNIVQPVLRSSYAQFGFSGGLNNDALDLHDLLQYLYASCPNTEATKPRFVLIGHSTGCQIIVNFLSKTRNISKTSNSQRTHSDESTTTTSILNSTTVPNVTTSLDLRELIELVVLQAPVSDRECCDLDQSMIEKSLKLVAKGHGHHFLTKGSGDANGISGDPYLLYGIAPLTAQRAVDLFTKNGADDFFSSDLTDVELRDRLGHMENYRTIIALSLDDEYVPLSVANYKAFGQRLQNAMQSSKNLTSYTKAEEKLLEQEQEKHLSASLLLLEKANHNLSKPKNKSAIRNLVQSIYENLLTS
eukprot:g1149.t1